jgi:hypothetical protein
MLGTLPTRRRGVCIVRFERQSAEENRRDTQEQSNPEKTLHERPSLSSLLITLKGVAGEAELQPAPLSSGCKKTLLLHTLRFPQHVGSQPKMLLTRSAALAVQTAPGGAFGSTKPAFAG